MKTTRRAAALLSVVAIAWIVGSGSLLAVQEGAAVARQVLTPEQMEDFLLNARVIATKGVNQGVTNTRRATLSDGRITHDAQIQTVDISLQLFKPPTGPAEMNFKDSYRYNIAGYRLAQLLELDNVPMSVERRVEGRQASVTWWVDDVMMDEGTRQKKQLRGPDTERTAMQIHIMRVFDELISNRDRNAGNLLWTADWKMWMIDHTRSFRLGSDLQKPALLERVERSLLENMRGLTAEALAKAFGNSLTRFESGAVLARRDVIVKFFEARIAERGEAAIVYALSRDPAGGSIEQVPPYAR
jgi:hypothetical protein